jgi:hypothetical protein
VALFKLVARRGFVHDGRAYRAGDTFEAPAVAASILVWRHHAVCAPPSAVVTPDPPSRRHSKRRDITPED